MWFARIIGAFILITAAVALIGLSGYMNYKFGLGKGNTSENAQMMGAVSVGFDLLKVMLPLLILILWHKRKLLNAAIATICFVGLVGYSLQSGFGFSMNNSLFASRTADLLQKKYDDLQDDLKSRKARKAVLPSHRPTATVLAAIDAQKLNRRWNLSAQCTDVTTQKSRIFCTEFNNMKAELATARQADKIEDEISIVQSKLNDFGTRQSQMSGDVQANAIADYFGISVKDAQRSGSIFFTCLLEFGSSFGLTFLSLFWTETRPKNQPVKRPVKTRKTKPARRKKPKPAPIAPVINETSDPVPVIELQPQMAVTSKTANDLQAFLDEPVKTPFQDNISPSDGEAIGQATKPSDSEHIVVTATKQMKELTQSDKPSLSIISILPEPIPAPEVIESDLDLNDFIKSFLIEKPSAMVNINVLYKQFEEWCKYHNIEPFGQLDFISNMNMLLEREPDKGAYHNLALAA